MLNFLIAVLIAAGAWWLVSKLAGGAKRREASSLPAAIAEGLDPRFVAVPTGESSYEIVWADSAGVVDGRHFTTYVEEVKAAKRAGNYDEALGTLYRLMDAVEAEAAARAPGWPIAPWYYGEAALLLRKLRHFDEEAAVHMRYIKACARVGQPVEQLAIERHAKAIERHHVGKNKAEFRRR